MHARSTITAAFAATATALILGASGALAADSVRFDRSAFDGAPVVSASGYTMAGATSGELGGYLTLSVQAGDGTVPAPGQCEAADVHAVLTVSPGESFTIETTGEICSHFIDGTPTVNAYFSGKQVTYAGSHKRARVSDGSIAFRSSFIGAQGSVGLSVRW